MERSKILFYQTKIKINQNKLNKNISYPHSKNCKIIDKIQKARILNKIGFYQSNISILKVFYITNKIDVKIVIRRGNDTIEYWDTKRKISYFFNILTKNRKLIPHKMNIYKNIKNNKTKVIIRGNNKTKLNIQINIGTLNVRGLNEKGKCEIMESYLMKNKIDICLLQETKLTQKPFFLFL